MYHLENIGKSLIHTDDIVIRIQYCVLEFFAYLCEVIICNWEIW